MLGKIITIKYIDPVSPIVNVYINNNYMSNTFINLGTSINVMTNDTMKILKLTNIRQTPTILQLTDWSTIKLQRIL